jgi:hypothetical protein
MLAGIKDLSFEERLLLLESLARDLREQSRQVTPKKSSINRIRGLLKPDGPLPTDAELADAYIDHLLEKHT